MLRLPKIRIRHKMFAMSSIMARALIHTSRLFFAVKPVDKAISRWEQKLQEHLARKPCQVRANSIFYQQAMAALRENAGGGVGSGRVAPLTLRESQKRLAQTQRKFATLPKHHRVVVRCQEAARLAELAKQQERAAHMLHTMKQLEAATFKKKCEEWKGLPPLLIFSSATFSPEQKEQLAAVLNSADCSQARVAKLRIAAQTHKMFSSVEFARLDAHKIVQAPEAKKPWWLPAVAWCRDAFAGTALRVGADSRSYFKFLFAKKSPQLATFSPLQLVEEQWTQPLDLASGAADICSPLCGWLYSFTCDRLAIKMAHEVDDQEEYEGFVLTGLIDDGSLIVADGPEYSLAQFVAGLPQLEKMGRQRREGSGRVSRSALQKEKWAAEVAEFPWLVTPTENRPTKRARPSPGAAGSSDMPADFEEEDEVSEESADAGEAELEDAEEDFIFAALDKQRREWADKYADEQMHDFTSGLLGGKCIFVAAKVVSDYVCCEATTKQAKAFVKKYGLHASKRASIKLYDGVHNATILVSAWGHMMQYFLDLYRRSGDDMYRFSAADLKPYTEQQEFVDLANREHTFNDVARSIRTVQPYFPTSA